MADDDSGSKSKEPGARTDRVRVFINDYMGNKKREANLASTAPVRQLVPALVTALGLPATDPDGNRRVYHLAFGDRPLQGDETLASAGVLAGFSVALIPVLTTSASLALTDGPDLTMLTEGLQKLEIHASEERPLTMLTEGVKRLEGGLKVVQEQLARLLETQEVVDVPVAPPTEPDVGQVEPIRRIVLSIIHQDHHHYSFVMEGEVSYAARKPCVLQQEPTAANLIVQGLGSAIPVPWSAGGANRWRGQLRHEGARLFSDLFEHNPELMLAFGFARQAVGDENLTLCFVGPRTHLCMHYEFLDDTTPLISRFPICRRVAGIRFDKGKEFATLLGVLAGSNEPLRVLLIASGQAHDHGADEEVALLAGKIKAQANSLRIACDPEPLYSKDATLETVSRRLNRSRHHLVHYVGESFGGGAGDGSEHGLLFRARPGLAEPPTERLHDWSLGSLLSGASTGLVYLNCDLGAALRDHELHDGACLGIIDALVSAGVPNVAGFRWKVPDGRARRDFAEDFYRALLETRSPPCAMYEARRAAHGGVGRHDPDGTWASALLIAQWP